MTNWLEEEENNNENLTNRMTVIHNNLKHFFDICERVNKLKPYKLEIKHLEVTGKHHTRFEIQPYRRRGFDYLPSDIDYLKRGIKFEVFDQDEMILSVFTRICGERDNDKPLLQGEIVSLCKKLRPQLLLNWEDEKILNLIKWISFESDSITDNLPGEELMTKYTELKSSLQSELNKLNNDLAQEEQKISQLMEWHFGRFKAERESQLKLQQGKIWSLTERIKENELILNERFGRI